jgi:hypothetical protein
MKTPRICIVQDGKKKNGQLFPTYHKEGVSYFAKENILIFKGNLHHMFSKADRFMISHLPARPSFNLALRRGVCPRREHLCLQYLYLSHSVQPPTASPVTSLFASLKSQTEKYCSLICCERKKKLYHG